MIRCVCCWFFGACIRVYRENNDEPIVIHK